jgi:type II secretory pathway component GspD/PulD (secretin)
MNSKVTRTLLGGAFVALLACQAMAEGKINGITTKVVADGLEVQIKGDQLAAPKITRVMGGRSFMLEFDASLISDPQWIRVEQAGVHYVQSVVAQSHPDKIRIFLRVDPNTKVDVEQNDQGYVVKTTGEPVAKKPAPVPATAAPQSLTIYHKTENLPDEPKPKPQPKPQSKHITATVGGHGGVDVLDKTVSLDFVNTDIVQILKALSMEAGVNIVTSPDVHGSLTVSLGTVPIKEAMDLITTMSGLRYAEVGNTYVVSNAGNIAHILENLGSKAPEVSETRVVPIYSGEGIHIKDALRTTVNDVEILLPSDKPLSQAAVNQASEAINGAQLADLATNGKGAPGAAGAQNPAAQAAGGGTEQKGDTKDAYLVLVGPTARIAAVEASVKDLDSELCAVEGINYPLTNVMVRQIYHPQGNTASALLTAISPTTDKTSGGQFHAKIGTVEAWATPSGSTGAQNIVLYGRETEVNKLMETLASIDELSTDAAGDYVVYGVKYLDPRALREDLVTKFPGLTVSIPAASAIASGVYTQGQAEKQNTEKAGQSLGTTEASNQAQSNSGSSAVTANGDDGSKVGITSPFAQDELASVPMKLVLRGNASQIKNALSYLSAIDVQPKQVALELRVMQLTKEDALNIGLNWSLLTGGTLQAFQMAQSGPASLPYPGGTIPNASAVPLTGTGQAAGTLGFPGGATAQITATLDQLASSNKMIARPNILALDGKESEMFVGDDIKYIQQIQSSQNGVTVTTGDVEVGVKMAVLPRIGADNSITMEMRPMVSTLESFTPVPGGGELPQTGLRIAQSSMIMHDGDTIAIGGLIQDTDSKSHGGWPILKDIPILNLLFGRTNNDHQRTEVVFFLTAKVVDTDTMANAANPWAHGPMQPQHTHKR